MWLVIKTRYNFLTRNVDLLYSTVKKKTMQVYIKNQGRA